MKRYNYSLEQDTYKDTYKQRDGMNTSWNLKEKFFVSYAVSGPVNVGTATRQGMPVRGPISGPVSQPSPLNSEYSAIGTSDYNISYAGIF